MLRDAHQSLALPVAFWRFALVESFRSTERRCESLSSGTALLPPTSTGSSSSAGSEARPYGV